MFCLFPVEGRSLVTDVVWLSYLARVKSCAEPCLDDCLANFECEEACTSESFSTRLVVTGSFETTDTGSASAEYSDRCRLKDFPDSPLPVADLGASSTVLCDFDFSLDGPVRLLILDDCPLKIGSHLLRMRFTESRRVSTVGVVDCDFATCGLLEGSECIGPFVSAF